VNVYVDTSILGAYYCPEPLSERAQEWLRALDDLPVVSLLTEVELTSLVAKKRRMRELTEAGARKVLFTFQTHLAEGYFHRCDLTSDDYRQARDLLAAMTISLTTLDAIHLAVTQRHGLSLLTADRQMARASKRLQIETTTVCLRG